MPPSCGLFSFTPSILPDGAAEGGWLHIINLNTHNASSFYENLPTDEAFALAERFEFYYTPKSASWLNMIEIEFSVVVRQCLSRRIPTIESLEQEVSAVIKECTDNQIKINWQFSIEVTRNKMNRHYECDFADNSQVKKTWFPE